MKKFFAVILAAVILLSCTLTSFAETEVKSDFGAYNSVVILGIDGAGAFFDNADTPNMDKIFAENSFVSHRAWAEDVTSSAQNWMSILTGVAFENHGIDNGIAATVERTSSEKYPTVFRTVRENMPNAELASICNWNPINFGIIENDVGVSKDTGENDDVVCDKVVDYLKLNTPQVLFVQFDNVDHVGHDKGFGSKPFIEAINTADGYIGRIYSALEEKGALDDTLFIVVSDHGGTRSGGHGALSLGERFVYVGVKGKTVGKSEAYGVHNRDVAAITLYALGIEPSSTDFAAAVPNGLFADASKELTAVDNILIFLEDALMKFVNIFANIGKTF